jgi:DNA invertase Pin-like site-specific DNA recombinase
MIYGYARVSTDAQDLAIQLDTLKAAGCERVFHDKEGGDSADRLQLKRLMKRLSAGDVVKAPATDRFARDPTDLLVLGRDIRTKGARFVSIAEPIVDTDSEFWELVAACFGIAAKFELRRIRERTAAGRAAAKAQGVKFGRKPKLTPHQKREALRRRDVDRGTTARSAAATTSARARFHGCGRDPVGRPPSRPMPLRQPVLNPHTVKMSSTVGINHGPLSRERRPQNRPPR